MSLTVLATGGAAPRRGPSEAKGAEAAGVSAACAASSEQLEHEIVTLPNKALRHAACELVAHAGAAHHDSAASLYRLLYSLERLQVSLAWCDALRAATLLASLPESDSARHRDGQVSLSRELRSCAGALEALCREARDRAAAMRLEHLRSRLLDAAAKLLDRLFCEERMLYPPLISELDAGVLHQRAVSVVEQLDVRGPLGRRQLLEFLLRAVRAGELPPSGNLLFR